MRRGSSNIAQGISTEGEETVWEREANS